MGLPLSTAARILMFGEQDKMISPYTDSDIKYKVLLAVQECRLTFKKISSRINNAVTVYDRSVDERDEDGRRLLSTSQTIRHIVGLTNTLMEIQKNFNVILDLLEAQPVHFAARPSSDTRIGKMINDERAKMASELQDESEFEKESPEQVPENNNPNEIPNKYRYMFKAFANGKIQEDATEFTTKKGNVMMKFTIKTMSFISGKENVHLIDVIKIKNGLFTYLKKGASVSVVGDYDEQISNKNGEIVIYKTIYADDISLP